MPKPDLAPYAARVVAAVKSYVAKSEGALSARLGALEARLQALPAPERGEQGEQGPAGQDAEVDYERIGLAIKDVVAVAVGEIPRPADGKDGVPGERGEAGPAGKDADMDALACMIEAKIDAQVQLRVAALPQPKDGEPGPAGQAGGPGKDGRDALELDVVPGIDDRRSYARGVWASHAGGLLRSTRATDPLEGKTPEEAGWLTVVEGLAAIVITQSEDTRKVIVSSVMTSGKQVAVDFDVPAVLYRGVYRPETPYVAGDMVTWGGSTWHADRKEPAKPGEPGSGWTLCVKKGRDAK